MRNLLLSFTTLAVLGGVASADRIHTQPVRGGGHGPVVVRDHRGPEGRGFERGPEGRGIRTPVRTVSYGGREARRPIYLNDRPVIRERYFDYRVRPQVIVENYAPMDGYTWIAGAWQWNGAEWMWTAGHYEPIADAGYYQPGY
jgi:hypothetical protein